MKSLKELLILLKQYIIDQEPNDFWGMCGEVSEMESRKIITSKEETRLTNYIDDNRKGRYYILEAAYWWKPGNKPPRLRWCDVHIKIN